MSTTTQSRPSTGVEPARRQRGSSKAFAFLQQLGKSLMLPVSILPAAGILLGVGGALLGGATQNGWELPAPLRVLI